MVCLKTIDEDHPLHVQWEADPFQEEASIYCRLQFQLKFLRPGG